MVFLALAITLIVAAGPHNTLSVFGAHTGNANGWGSVIPGVWGSVIPGVLYAVFGIIGFEAAAPLGEEAREPKRTVPRAVVLSCLAIGVFYLICYYAATVYWGPGHMAGFAGFNAGDPWSGLANNLVPVIGAAALVPVLLAAFEVDFAGLGITGLTYPADLAPLICLAWMVLGLVLLGYFLARDRSRITETRRVFTEQTPAEQQSR